MLGNWFHSSIVIPQIICKAKARLLGRGIHSHILNTNNIVNSISILFLYFRGHKTAPLMARMELGRSSIPPRNPGLQPGWAPFKPSLKKEYLNKGARAPVINEALELLKIRKDKEALVIFDKILIDEPDNLDASWGRAEVLRRARDYKESEILLNEILKKNPKHIPSLISLAYIAYKDDELNQALQLINQALESGCADKNNEALAYVMLGTINSRRSAKSHLFNKIKYGTQIKCHFLRAKSLAPDLPEVHLSLGTFYLLAPAIFGRNLDKAREELELAIKIAPDFATANARLAQCYKKQGIYDKYNFYIERAKNLDPGNEVVRELKE